MSSEQPPHSREREAVDHRKRRHTGLSPEPDRRTYPHPAHFTAARPISSFYSQPNPQDPHAGSSRDALIDLTSPPRPVPLRYGSMSRRPSSHSHSHSHPPPQQPQSPRQDSEILLPRWQPDAEATVCPVCNTAFGFLNRRHHCRKCGRVVCDPCSKHRITIPSEYIVTPEGAAGSEGGGQNVRVCRPCVPDPWTPPLAPTLSAPRAVPDVGGGESDAAAAMRQARMMREAAQRIDMVRRSRAHMVQEQREQELFGPAGREPYAPRRDPPPAFGASLDSPRPMLRGSAFARIAETPARLRRATMHQPPFHDREAPPPPPPAHASSASRSEPPTTAAARPPRLLPRRQIAEEDECPVCGDELPPGPGAREAHITSCIESRFAPSPSAHLPPPSPTATRPRASSHRPRGMALYAATEKDCTSASGEAQECVICFEEFQPGDELGRMECWCTFHRACIRRWWETKGGGSCPTHGGWEG